MRGPVGMRQPSRCDRVRFQFEISSKDQASLVSSFRLRIDSVRYQLHSFGVIGDRDCFQGNAAIRRQGSYNSHCYKNH